MGIGVGGVVGVGAVFQDLGPDPGTDGMGDARENPDPFPRTEDHRIPRAGPRIFQEQFHFPGDHVHPIRFPEMIVVAPIHAGAGGIDVPVNDLPDGGIRAVDDLGHLALVGKDPPLRRIGTADGQGLD